MYLPTYVPTAVLLKDDFKTLYRHDLYYNMKYINLESRKLSVMI